VEKKMKILNIFAAILLSLVTVGCGSSNSTPALSVLAPASISGKTLKVTISSGSGGFATTGTGDIVFSGTTNQYVLRGDTVNTADSAGTFSYSSSSNIGTIAVDDSGYGKGSWNLTFTSITSGTYTAYMEQNPSASQTGSFVVQ
jgi:hypothetical protein